MFTVEIWYLEKPFSISTAKNSMFTDPQGLIVTGSNEFSRWLANELGAKCGAFRSFYRKSEQTHLLATLRVAYTSGVENGSYRGSVDGQTVVTMYRFGGNVNADFAARIATAVSAVSAVQDVTRS